MSGKRSIDTLVVVRLLNGEPGLLEKFDAVEEIFLSPVVVGELLFGAYNSARNAENAAKVEALVQDCTLLQWKKRVSECYGEVKVSLRRKGKPIPENDVWIAAFAMAYALTLVTTDPHFDEVEGLTVERW